MSIMADAYMKMFPMEAKAKSSSGRHTPVLEVPEFKKAWGIYILRRVVALIRQIGEMAMFFSVNCHLLRLPSRDHVPFIHVRHCWASETLTYERIRSRYVRK